MRNFNHKNHNRPLTHNSFKKSQRKYPQPIKLHVSKIVQQKPLAARNTVSLTQPQVVSTFVLPNHEDNKISQKYALTLQNPFPVFDRKSSQIDSDQYCLWFKNIQTMEGGKRKIIIKQTDYTVSDWVDDNFPAIIYLTLDGVAGYLNQNGVTTNRIAVLRLSQAQTIQRNNVIVYDLLYKIKKQVQWQLPKDLTHIKIGVMAEDGTQMQMPLPQPLNIQIQIKNSI